MPKLIRTANRAPNRSVRNRNFEQSKYLRRSMPLLGICNRKARRIYRQAVAYMKQIGASLGEYPLDTIVNGSFVWDTAGAAGAELHAAYSAIPYHELDLVRAQLDAMQAASGWPLIQRVNWEYGTRY